MGKSGWMERAQLANQFQGFRIPDRSDAWENKNVYYFEQTELTLGNVHFLVYLGRANEKHKLSFVIWAGSLCLYFLFVPVALFLNVRSLRTRLAAYFSAVHSVSYCSGWDIWPLFTELLFQFRNIWKHSEHLCFFKDVRAQKLPTHRFF